MCVVVCACITAAVFKLPLIVIFSQTLKQQNMHLENRNQLVMGCQLGPTVFINCAGFIKIDTTSVGDR